MLISIIMKTSHQVNTKKLQDEILKTFHQYVNIFRLMGNLKIHIINYTLSHCEFVLQEVKGFPLPEFDYYIFPTIFISRRLSSCQFFFVIMIILA